MAEPLELLGQSLEAFRTEETQESPRVEGTGNVAAKRFSPIDRSQMMIRPVCVDKLVAEDHPVRAIWAMVSQLDMSRFEESVKVVEGGKGRSSSDPRLLAALWIYAYSEGINSAREIARMCIYEPGFQWLTGMKEINYHTLSDFRTWDKDAIDHMFVQVLGVLSAEGLTHLKRVMQDGTKVKAQASRNSFRREETLREHLKLAPVTTPQEGTDYNQLADGIDRVKANMTVTPEQMVVDGGYVKNENIEKTAAQGVDLIAPVTETDSEPCLRRRGIRPEFYPDKFQYDEAANTFTCPAGKTLPFQRTQRRKGRMEYQYRAEKADCAACPFRNQCCPKASSRWIVRQEYSEAVKAFRAKMQTDPAKQIYRTRAEVAEFPNAWIRSEEHTSELQ